MNKRPATTEPKKAPKQKYQAVLQDIGNVAGGDEEEEEKEEDLFTSINSTFRDRVDQRERDLLSTPVSFIVAGNPLDTVKADLTLLKDQEQDISGASTIGVPSDDSTQDLKYLEPSRSPLASKSFENINK
mgnify:CR=1 FL=1